MLDFLIISHYFVGFFWEFKILNAIHLILALSIVFYLSAVGKLTFTPCDSDKLLIYFLVYISFVQIANFNQETFIDYLKIFACVIFYYIGRILPLKIINLKLTGVISFYGLLIFFLAALLGRGYQYWGSVNTFSGGYYFKTDLAIAVLIFLLFIFFGLKNKFVHFLSVFCALYLIFLSNARIALPIVFLIPIIFLGLERKWLVKINWSFILILPFVAMIGFSLFSLIDSQSSNRLGFDFSDPFSAANTQGRSIIWDALLNSYFSSGFFQQVFGMGFDADSRATMYFSESPMLEGVRAHNSYLYLLLSIGIFGSALFYLALYSIFSKIKILLRSENKSDSKLAAISLLLLLIFIFLSLSTEIIIRPQLMIVFFMFSGLHVQAYLNLLKNREKIRI